MRVLATSLLLLIFSLAFGQSNEHREKFRGLKPVIWLGIWDKENSDELIVIDTVSYDEIPKYLEFRGTVVEALRWTDSLGNNLLIQTVIGQFDWKYGDEVVEQGKSELYAYLFRKPRGEQEFKRIWKMYDFNECFGVDWFTGFIPKATTITDIDNDGISEITMPYVQVCRGGMDPGAMKIIMYQGDIKYALRGSTMLLCEGDHPYGGEFEPTDNLKKDEIFKAFLSKRWDSHKCENGRFY